MIEMIFEAVLDYDTQATRTRVLFCDAGPRLERQFELQGIPVPDDCESAEEATYDWQTCQQMATHQGMRAFAAHVEVNGCTDWLVVSPKFYCVGGPTS